MKPLFLLAAFVLSLSLLAPPRARAQDNFEPPVPVRTVQPKFPPDMRRDGIGGVVTVRCTIDEKGNVTDPQVEKTTHESFVTPAIEALSKWKFKPAKKEGTAVSLKVSIPIRFSVSEE